MKRELAGSWNLHSHVPNWGIGSDHRPVVASFQTGNE